MERNTGRTSSDRCDPRDKRSSEESNQHQRDGSDRPKDPLPLQQELRRIDSSIRQAENQPDRGVSADTDTIRFVQ
jgi:hypothetical protein